MTECIEFGIQGVWIDILVPMLTSCTSLGKFITLFKILMWKLKIVIEPSVGVKVKWVNIGKTPKTMPSTY